MAAWLSPAAAARDAFVAAGIGFALGALYCLLRFALGGRAGCAAADALILPAAAVCCRAAAAGVFAAGVLHAYTLGAGMLGFFCCTKLFLVFFCCAGKRVRQALFMPVRLLWHHMLCPACKKVLAHCPGNAKKRAVKPNGPQKKHLQNAAGVLYNSL